MLCTHKRAFDNYSIMLWFFRCLRHQQNYAGFLRSQTFIATTTLGSVLITLSDHPILSHLSFLRQDLFKIALFVCKTDGPFLSMRNRHTATPLLTTSASLNRLAMLHRLTDPDSFFRQHSTKLSDLFWEAIDDFTKHYHQESFA